MFSTQQTGLDTKGRHNAENNRCCLEYDANQNKIKSRVGENSLQRLHHTVGNQVVGGMFNSVIQPKLKLGPSDDKYEREADSLAEHVMTMPEPKFALGSSEEAKFSSSLSSNSIQRRCASCSEDEQLVKQKISKESTPDLSPSISSRITALQGGGRPMSPSEKRFFEPRFEKDFSNVRVHSNTPANKAAQSINARAFTLGNNVVFGASEYSSNSHSGKKLFAHELTHVVQQSQSGCLNNTHVIQRDGHTQPQPCRNIGSCIGRIAMIAHSQSLNPKSASAVVDDLMLQLRGFNLSDPNNLSEIVQEVSDSFSNRIFATFLHRLEAEARGRGETSPLEQMRAQQAHQRTIEQMQNLTAPRRGPYGMRGPGVLLPVLGEMLRPLYNMYRSAKGFVRGVINGFRQTATPQDYQRLVEKLASSVIITAVFPIVFIAGAVAGIVRDIVDAIVGIYRAVVNFDEVVASAKQILSVMFSDQGEQVAEELGTQTGIGYVGKLRSLLSQNIFSFTFNLGRIIGPTIIYAIISILGLPVVLGAAGLSLRVINAIRAVLRRIPGARRLRALIRLRRMRRSQALAAGGGTSLVVQGGRVRLTVARLLEWERLGGHALQRHGPFHTRETLLRRILNETSLGGPPAPRNLPGGARTTDFRVWRGNRQPHASGWRNQQEMLDAIGEIIGDNIDDIQRVTAGGGEVVLSRIPLNRPVGNGWVTAIRGTGERGIYWTENLQHATIVIRPSAGGGWRVVTAYPEL